MTACRSTLRASIALVSFIQALVILSYYIPTLANNLQYSVSDLLFADPVYRALLSTCMGLLLALCFTYIVTERHRHSAGEIPGSLLVVALVAWIVLNLYYRDASGTILPTHIVAAGCYIVSMGFYIILVFLQEEPMTVTACTVLMACLLGLAIIMASMTAFCFFTQNDLAWAFEHAAFALFTVTHALLFSLADDNNY
jgi:hypothetical protein